MIHESFLIKTEIFFYLLLNLIIYKIAYYKYEINVIHLILLLNSLI